MATRKTPGTATPRATTRRPATKRAAAPKRKLKPKVKPERPAGKVLTDDSGDFV